MKRKATILTLAVTMILGFGCVALAAKAGKAKRNIAAPQQITIYYGDIPVSLTANSFQTSFDLAALAR